MEKINNQVEAAECHVSDINELKKTVKRSSIKIEDLSESISSMEEKLQSIKNETLNVEGKIKNLDILSFILCILILKWVILFYLECKLELAKINDSIKTIDSNIFPVRSNLESVKNKLKGLTEKMYG